MQQKETMLQFQFPLICGRKTEWKVISSKKLVLVTISTLQHFNIFTVT